MLPQPPSGLNSEGILAAYYGQMLYNELKGRYEYFTKDDVWLNVNEAAQPIDTKTADYTIAATDFTILCDTSANDITISLPSALSMTGRIFCIKKIEAANLVIVDADGSETIDGSLTQVLTAQWTNLKIQSNGTNWFIL